MAHLVFLHTAEANVTTYERMTLQQAPGTATTHIVDSELLARARSTGLHDAELAAAIGARLQRFGAAGDVVVCTCSTIGALAESIGRELGVRTMRIDRPMAAQAVSRGHRIAVVVAVESTVEPTCALVREEAAAAGRDVELVPSVCAGAWERFEAGDHRGYADAIVAHVRALADDVDVVVLAQGSMLAAGERLQDLAVTVLSSPRLGVAAALAAAGSSAAGSPS